MPDDRSDLIELCLEVIFCLDNEKARMTTPRFKGSLIGKQRFGSIFTTCLIMKVVVASPGCRTQMNDRVVAVPGRLDGPVLFGQDSLGLVLRHIRDSIELGSVIDDAGRLRENIRQGLEATAQISLNQHNLLLYGFIGHGVCAGEAVDVIHSATNDDRSGLWSCQNPKTVKEPAHFRKDCALAGTWAAGQDDFKRAAHKRSIGPGPIRTGTFSAAALPADARRGTGASPGLLSLFYVGQAKGIAFYMRGMGEADETAKLPRPEPGFVYSLSSPEGETGVWDGECFIVLSRANDRLVRVRAKPQVLLGRIDDPDIRLSLHLSVVCSYCGGNLQEDPETGNWISAGACDCSLPSPVQQENYALKAELEDFAPL